MNSTLNPKILIAEVVGTAVLIMGGPGSAILAAPVIGVYGVAIAFGLSLAIMAYVIGPISGCHINPAVTLGLWVRKKIDQTHAISAVIGQIIGGFIGAAIIFVIVQASGTTERGTFAANQFGEANGFANLGAAIVVEIVFTAVLVFAVLATTSRAFAPAMGGLVVGLTLALIHLVTIPIDNTSVNPVRSLVTAVFAETPAGGTAPIAQIWVFIIFPLIGGVIGATLWALVNSDEEGELSAA
jgi:aquaporin Z